MTTMEAFEIVLDLARQASRSEGLDEACEIVDRIGKDVALAEFEEDEGE